MTYHLNDIHRAIWVRSLSEVHSAVSEYKIKVVKPQHFLLTQLTVCMHLQLKIRLILS